MANSQKAQVKFENLVVFYPAITAPEKGVLNAGIQKQHKELSYCRR